MERVYTIGADTHCAFTELVTISPGGRLVRRDRCATTIQALVRAISEVSRPRVMVIEEGPLADWLYRGLSERGETDSLRWSTMRRRSIVWFSSVGLRCITIRLGIGFGRRIA